MQGTKPNRTYHPQVHPSIHPFIQTDHGVIPIHSFAFLILIRTSPSRNADLTGGVLPAGGGGRGGRARAGRGAAQGLFSFLFLGVRVPPPDQPPAAWW